jgi:RNA polymerase sigma factor (sigma-70 family)
MTAEHNPPACSDPGLRLAGDDRSQWVSVALAEHEGPLLRYACRLTGNLERARDVVQDTFLKLWEADRASVDGHLREWLFTVCRNRALDVHRKEQRMTTASGNGMLDNRAEDAARPARGEDGRESRSRLLAALAGLPDRQQEIIRLKFQNDLSYQEIARVMDLTVSNVGFILHTALKTLRQRLLAARAAQEHVVLRMRAASSRVVGDAGDSES